MVKDPVCRRDWDDAHLLDVIHEFHADDATLGYRFITDELEHEHGIQVGEKRVHRLCRTAGIHVSHLRPASPSRRHPVPLQGDVSPHAERESASPLRHARSATSAQRRRAAAGSR